MTATNILHLESIIVLHICDHLHIPCLAGLLLFANGYKILGEIP